jgi:hypothetical protein
MHGRALFNAFKAISSAFEQPEKEEIESSLVSTTVR